MLSLLLIHFCLIAPTSEGDHAIFISVLEVDSHQMKIKVFTDNLQDALRNDTGHLPPSTQGNFHIKNAHAIASYFRKKVQLQINEKEVDLNFLEATLEGDSYWITFELDFQEKWRSLKLEATYLFELFPFQTNVVKVMGEKQHFFRLSKHKPDCSVTF